MTATTTKSRKPRAKQPRTVTVLTRPVAGSEGKLLITEGKVSDVYFVREVPTDFPGRAFRVEKFGMDAGESYDCHIGPAPTCECKGHVYHGHCRHVEALTALDARNLI